MPTCHACTLPTNGGRGGYCVTCAERLEQERGIRLRPEPAADTSGPRVVAVEYIAPATTSSTDSMESLFRQLQQGGKP